jgi:hypothetical protein
MSDENSINASGSKRIQITLDREQYKVFKRVKGAEKDSTKARDIIMSWLHEKTFVKDYSLEEENRNK